MSEQVNQQIRSSVGLICKAREEISRRIIGQRALLDGLLMGLVAGGHVLVEGVPGLAKTCAVRSLADISSLEFKRIQFTPDLLPADLTGTMIYHQYSSEFVPRKGPIFSNIVLADEINRAPAKVQSALLEAMAEGQVTIGNCTYPLPQPFFTMATQNPIEQEGTYRLPEAQTDRFLIKIRVDYPSPGEELSILDRVVDKTDIKLKSILNSEQINLLRQASCMVKSEEAIRKYIVSLVSASRERDRRLPFTRYIEHGASPRATISILQCARVRALFEGRDFVLPEDVKAVATMALRHRIILSYEAEAEEMDADAVVESLLAAVIVP